MTGGGLAWTARGGGAGAKGIMGGMAGAARTWAGGVAAGASGAAEERSGGASLAAGAIAGLVRGVTEGGEGTGRAITGGGLLARGGGSVTACIEWAGSVTVRNLVVGMVTERNGVAGAAPLCTTEDGAAASESVTVTGRGATCPILSKSANATRCSSTATSSAAGCTRPGRASPLPVSRHALIAEALIVNVPVGQCAGGASACSASREMRENPAAATAPIVRITAP